MFSLFLYVNCGRRFVKTKILLFGFVTFNPEFNFRKDNLLALHLNFSAFSEDGSGVNFYVFRLASPLPSLSAFLLT